MAAYDEVVIISGCRTPVGKFQGSLADLSATQLGAIVVREAVKRAGLDSKQSHSRRKRSRPKTVRSSSRAVWNR